MTTLGLVEGAVDEHLFEAVYRERYVGLVRLAYLLLSSRHEAEEVVQEAFAALHRRWASVDVPGAYVRTAVVNGCRSRQRRAAVERSTLYAADRDARGLGADELFDAIAGLPQRQRAVIVLRYYEDMSEAEIAAALGCRPGTVKSLSSRALAELRRVVEQ
jgi:RNA polymerase sigma-70 factor (sigma-E family)